MIAAANFWILGFWFALAAYGAVLSAIFSGMETSIYMVNRVRLDLQVESGVTRAKAVRPLLNRIDDILGVILIGNNIHNYLMTFAVSTIFVLLGYRNHVEWYAMIVTTPILFIFAESIPKNVSQRTPEHFLYATVWVIRFFDVLFKVSGMTYLLRMYSRVILWVTGREKTEMQSLLGHEALFAAVAEGHAAGALSRTQRDMADRVMRISEIRVQDVLQPMAKVIAAPVDVERDPFLQRIVERNVSRIPLLDANQQVTGVVDVLDVLADETPRPIHVYAIDPMTVSVEMTVTQALYAMQRAKRNFAVVTTPAGEHVGIITIKDLVEEIVGELEEW